MKTREFSHVPARLFTTFSCVSTIDSGSHSSGFYFFKCPLTSTDVNWLTKRLAHLVFIFLDLVVETCNQCCQYFFKFVCKEVVFLHHNVEHNLVTVDFLD